MHQSQIAQPKQGFQLEVLDDEVFLYDKVSSKAIYPNSSAALAWQLYDGKRSIQIIRKTPKDAYLEKADGIVKDIDESLTILMNEERIHLL